MPFFLLLSCASAESVNTKSVMDTIVLEFIYRLV
jgi:hypothetical protein